MTDFADDEEIGVEDDEFECERGIGDKQPAPIPAPTPPDLLETLQRLRGDIKPRRIAAFDIETQEWDWPYACGFYEASMTDVAIWTSRRTRPRVWPYQKKGDDCIDLFLNFYLQPRFLGTTCYAHNGGNFDFLPLLERLFCERRFSARGYRLKLASIQSCLYRLEFSHPAYDGKWIFLDSTRTLPMTLDAAGEAFTGKKKVDLAELLKVPKGRLYRELSRLRHDDVLKKYLRRDVLLLWHTMRNFQALVNSEGANLKSTIGSTAMDVFRRKFLRSKVYINRHLSTCPDLRAGTETLTCHGCGHRYFREAFYGGRTEIFTTSYHTPRPNRPNAPEAGQGDLYLYDVNSMYPWAMTQSMPTGMASVIEGGDGETVLRQGRTMIGIIDCDVEIPADTYLPPLPKRIRFEKSKPAPVGVGDRRPGSKLAFPTGSFRGVWDTAELSLLPEVGGRITKVHRQAWFSAEPLFAPYVAQFYAYRDKKDPKWTKGRSEFGKRMGNHLFGKYAQGELQEELFLDPPYEAISKLKLYSTARLGIFWKYTDHKPDHVAPQLAVHITALARVRLWRILSAVRAQGGRVYYCDTDSVVCSFPAGVAPWPSESQLGGLKMEHHLRRAQFVLPKLYLVECHDDCPCGWLAAKKARVQVKAKGMSPGLGRRLSPSAWERLTDLGIPPEERQWRRRHILKWKTAIDTYHKDQLRFFRVGATTKAIQSTYDKRRVVAKGPHTIPHVLIS